MFPLLKLQRGGGRRRYVHVAGKCRSTVVNRSKGLYVGNFHYLRTFTCWRGIVTEALLSHGYQPGGRGPHILLKAKNSCFRCTRSRALLFAAAFAALYFMVRTRSSSFVVMWLSVALAKVLRQQQRNTATGQTREKMRRCGGTTDT